MNKGLRAFRTICRNMSSSYEFTDEYKKNKKLIENLLKEKASQDSIIKILKEIIKYDIQFPLIEPNDSNGYDFITTIRINAQRDMENKERELLRQWILKECFPEELKILKIIRNKVVDFPLLLCCASVEIYNHYIIKNAWTSETKKLIQEEFDLLKEVIL